jgi:hypoxanthine phosphoribosyltransferase
MRLSEKPLIAAEELQARIAALGETISEAYGDTPVVVVCVLKGGILFTADLVRHLRMPVEVECIRARSYEGQESTGTVELSLMPDAPLRDRHVIVVEDILDTGRSATVIMEALQQEQPASLKLCALLDKPSRRVVPVEGDWVGFTIEDHFVVGYGLDFNERLRELPAIYVMEAE